MQRSYMLPPPLFPASRPHVPVSSRLRIVYYNDIHEKFRAFPRLKTAFDHYGREAERQGIDVLKLCGGDWNVGKESDQLRLDIMLNDTLELVASAPGNHEFDAGEEGLAEGLKTAGYKTIATNLHVPKQSQLYQRVKDGSLVTGPKVYVTSNNQRYGFVGVTVAEVKKLLNPDAQLNGVASLPLDQTIRRVQRDVDQLRAQGIKRIILLSHAGYNEDLEIARRTRGINIIVGGHSHTELPGVVPGKNYVQGADGEPVMIVQAGMNGLFGILDVEWDDQNRVVPLAHTIHNHQDYPDDPYSVWLIDTFLGPERVIATMAQEVSHKNSAAGGENSASDKVADAIREGINRRDPQGVDIALFRGSELRNDILKGPFTDRDLAILLPFRDKLVKVQMTGSQIMEALNESARCLKIHEIHPGILHPSGLRYVVDKQAGRATGVLVENRQTRRWEPLVPNKTYTVAVGDFVVKNKTEYPVFKRTPVLARYDVTLRDTFREYLVSQKGRPIDFRTDGRLTVINDPNGNAKGPLNNHRYPSALQQWQYAAPAMAAFQ